MDKRKKVTLKDISKASGYSVYTVSCAFNDNKDIPQKTKDKILKIAQELGYIQNITARNLRLGKTKTIGIIYDDFLNPYYSIVIKNLFYYLKQYGYDATLFYDFGSISNLNVSLMNRVIANNVEGVITLIDTTKEAFELAHQYKIPLVQHGSKSEIKEMNCVYFDDIGGGEAACNYLIAQGKKRIGFISAGKEQRSSSLRIEGYKQSLLENGLNVDENLIIYLKEDQLDAHEAITKLLNLHVDGIVTFNDFTGYVVQSQLETMNLKNISVVGFDNLASCYPFTNKIRSVGGDLNESSRLCVERVLKLIEGEKTILQKMLPMGIN